MICTSDNSVGQVILDKKLYRNIACDHSSLHNNIYKNIEYNPLNDQFKFLNNNGYISNRFFKKSLPDSNSKLKIMTN